MRADAEIILIIDGVISYHGVCFSYTPGANGTLQTYLTKLV